MSYRCELQCCGLVGSHKSQLDAIRVPFVPASAFVGRVKYRGKCPITPESMNKGRFIRPHCVIYYAQVFRNQSFPFRITFTARPPACQGNLSRCKVEHKV